MYIHVILSVALAFVALYVFYKRGPKKGKAIPGPTGLPIIGYAHKMNDGPVHKVFFKLAKKYGGIFHINSLGQNIIVLNDANLVRSIFCDEQYKRFTNDRPKIFLSEKVLFQCKGIFATPDAFNSPLEDLRKNFVRGMHVYGEGIKAFEESIEFELAKFNEQIESFDGKCFNLQPLIKIFLYNLVSIFLSGQPTGDEATRRLFWEYDKCVDYFLKPDVNLILSAIPALRFVPGAYKKAYDEMIHARDAYLQRYVTDAKKTFTPGKIRGLVDFFHNEQRLTQTESCSDEQICAMALETNGAGVLTTLSHLTSFFLCVMNYPEYQTKIQEEIDRVMGTDRSPSYSDKHDCVFIEAVTLEVHRYITSLPSPAPRQCTPNIAFQDYDLPANSMLFTNTWFIHHDEKIWGDPWTFRPERWIDDDGALLPNDHVLRKNWIAFGTGRRQCIAESLARSRTFLFVTTLLQRWSFYMPPEHAMSCDPRDGTMDVDVTCRPKPYLCRAVPRKHIRAQK